MTNQTNQLPPEIYRRRRIAAVVVLIVLLLLIGWGVKALVGRGDSETQSEEVTVSRTDGEPGAGTASPKQPYPDSRTRGEKDGTKGDKGDKREGNPGDEPTDSSSPSTDADAAALAQKKECTLQDLQLTVTSDRPNYGAEKPKFSLTLHNPTGAECNINLDEQKLRFEVYTLDEFQRVWSDLDCFESEGKGNLKIAPDKDAIFTATWSRLGSAPGRCTEAERQEVQSGNYLLYGLVGDKNSDGHTFNLN